MSFNPDPSKQAQEFFLTRNIKKMTNTPIFFNVNLVQQVSSQKHFGFTLDLLFTFDKHTKELHLIINKTTSVLLNMITITKDLNPFSKRHH